MREIKFRTWDNCCNAPEFRDSGMSDSIETRTFGNLLTFSDAIQMLWPDSVLLQYTGLKDKNGKEIYEGDILRCSFMEREIGVIQWHGNGFWIKWPNGDLSLPIEMNREVIGNIYENPELLEEA
jgi:uncharacterized phage protein (TIGR01671 family)